MALRDIGIGEFKKQVLEQVQSAWGQGRARGQGAARRGGTWYEYNRAFTRLEEATGITRLSQLTPNTLNQAKVKWTDSGVGPYEVLNRIKSIKAAMRQAEAMGLSQSHNWSVVKKPRVPKGRLEFYTEGQLELLLAAACSHPDEPGLLRKMFYLCYMAGMRPSEASHAQRKDVDFEAGTIAVRHKPDIACACGYRIKDNEVRTVDLWPELAEILADEHSGDAPEAFLARPKESEHWTLNPIQHRWKAIVAGSVGIGTLYTLRHTFATHLIAKGADIYWLKGQMGHESVSTTEIYVHNMPRPKPDILTGTIRFRPRRMETATFKNHAMGSAAA